MLPAHHGRITSLSLYEHDKALLRDLGNDASHYRQALRDAADTRGERSLAKLKILRKVLEPLLRTTEDKDVV